MLGHNNHWVYFSTGNFRPWMESTMSRTTRQRHLWIKYWNIDDPRSAFPHGRDGKPCSLLYEDYVMQRGWSRDFHNGPGGRAWRKKSNRRWQRRNARRQINSEVLE